jgi:cell division protein FtsL
MELRLREATVEARLTSVEVKTSSCTDFVQTLATTEGNRAAVTEASLQRTSLEVNARITDIDNRVKAYASSIEDASLQRTSLDVNARISDIDDRVKAYASSIEDLQNQLSLTIGMLTVLQRDVSKISSLQNSISLPFIQTVSLGEDVINSLLLS